jgi:acyl-CoA synthetase (AMP-forming)/AMP-acid ligase II
MALNETLKKIINTGTALPTSGTTGAPRRIFQPPHKLQAANSVARQVQDITVNSRILTVCTLEHAGGLLAQTLPAVEVGALVDIQKFNPYSWVRQITDYTHSHLTPDMARAVIKTRGFNTLNLSGITIMCGSDRVHSRIIQSFIDRGATFIANWGMTEVGPVAINSTFTPGDTVSLTESIMGDQIHCDTKIVDGELLVKGDICVYDDWYHTGDLVTYNNRVYYYLGRIDAIRTK